MSDSSFLSRWSRRKVAVREGKAVPNEPPAPVVATPPPAPVGEPALAVEAAPAEPLPTLDDAALLKPGDNIARFVASGVDQAVKRAALKTLFADPHFNVMDGLDIYIDDYSKSEPIPMDVLRRMRQSEALGLFEPTDEEREAARAAQAALESGPAGSEMAAAEPAAEPADVAEPQETPVEAAPPALAANEAGPAAAGTGDELSAPRPAADKPA
ncbi:DUF3306 domain-containing protein [Cupriavidus respiraculi]|uniref:DUF3306 domain-containing protein n=1 Tax=Cupriavidus respiraculi TaxID=195930 RepID=A0ABN7YZE6_9BURK|nr:DUF3306 domain-containing protein [Cupriavidus respiraculi]CAG9177646.1 hypothetical protein LMG21510_03352 [Cupriavidus respiraculi]